MPEILVTGPGNAPESGVIPLFSGSDRRQAPRLPGHALPWITGVSLFPGDAAVRLIDVSRTGALLEATAPLALGQPIALLMGGSEGEQRIAGRVVRSDTIPIAAAPGIDCACRAAVRFETPLPALPLVSPAPPPAADELGRRHGRGAPDEWPPEVTEAAPARDAEWLYRLALIDHLTGCYNRRFFEDVIVREIGRHRRYGLPLAVLFIDVDDLKQVNDRHGHLEGDRVLKQVAQFLSRRTRRSDYVFRWGGDEFLVLSECTREQADQKAEQLKAAFPEMAVAQGLPPGVGLSVGCAEFGADQDAVDEVVRLADQRMYGDKSSRRAGLRLEERAAVDRDREGEQPPAAGARSGGRREDRWDVVARLRVLERALAAALARCEELGAEHARARERLEAARRLAEIEREALAEPHPAERRTAEAEWATQVRQQLRALAIALRAVEEQIRAVAGSARGEGLPPGGR
jgi:diguanylate cyclase (GGDEF)-like protein